MTISGRQRRGFAGVQNWFSLKLLQLLLLPLLAWSGQALATTVGCEIQYNSPANVTVDAGTTNTFTFDIVTLGGGCPATITGTVVVNSDSTGGASASPASWTGTVGSTVSIDLTVGPNPGQFAQFTVNCSNCFNGNNNLIWGVSTNSTWDLIPDAQNFAILPGQALTLGVTYLVNGSPSGLDTLWSVDDSNGFVTATVPTDGAGHASNTFNSNTPGTYIVTVQGACPVILFAPTTNCPPTPETYTIVVQDPVLTPVSPAGGAATIPQNSSIALRVEYKSTDLVVPDGTPITYRVTSEPASGAGTFTAEDFGPPSTKQALTSGGFAEVTLNVTVPGTYVVEACNESDGCLTNDDKTTFTITVPATQADMSVSKTDSPDPVVRGFNLTYTITVANAGPDPALAAALTDALPPGLTFVSLTAPAGWSCTTPAVGSGGTVSCTNPSLAVDPSEVFTLVAAVPAGFTGATASNTATVSTTTTDPVGPNNSSTTTTVVTAPAPAMTVDKVLAGSVDNDGSTTLTAGDQLNYTVTATNSGNVPLNNVVVSDDHFTGTQTCPTVAPGGTCVLNTTYLVTAGDAATGSVTNIGSATSTEVPGPVTDTVVTPIVSNADLSITKTDAPDPIAPGLDVTYTITLGNAGPNTAIQAVWTDVLPAQMGFVSLSTVAGWTCTTPAVGATGTVSCSNPSFAMGASPVFTLVTKIAPATTPGTINNTATISSNTADPAIGNNSSTTATSVIAGTPGLSVAKVLSGTVDNDGSSTVTIGDRLDYTVTATNSGNTLLTNVVVSDDHFAATQSCPSLVPGATCVLTGSYIVTAADANTESVTNIGRATSTQVPGPISSSVITPVVPPATLGIGSGDGQTTPALTQFPQPLTVVAAGTATPPASPGQISMAKLMPEAAPVSGLTINWTVVSGSASLAAPSSATDASGVASMTVFAGPVEGPVVIRATRADQPTVSVDFHLTVAPANALAGLPGLPPNLVSLAEVLDEICTGTGIGGNANETDLQQRCKDLILAITTDPTGVIEALDQLLADIALVQSESSLLAAQSQFDNIKARIAALRSGTNRTGFGGLALNTSSGSLPIGTMFQSLMQDDTPSGPAKEVGTDFSRWGFFASGTIGRGNADAGSLSPAYDFDINGLTVGADYRKSDKLIFGGTLGYTRQTNDLTGRPGSLDTKGWSVSAYGTYYQQNSWYMDGVLSYGRNSYEVERHIRYTITTPTGTSTIDQTGHSEGDGDTTTFAISVGRDFNKGPWGFGPYLRAMYTRMTFDSFSERFDSSLPGFGLALEFDTRDVTSLSSTLGGKLTYAHSASWGVLIPHLQLEWQHEFESDPSEVEARFLYDPTGTPFTIHGDPVDTDFFRFGVGMSFVMTKGRSGFFYYERLISRERFSQNSLALGIRIEF